MEKESVALLWFRRDLRLYDNAALYQASLSGYKILPIFIFDIEILSTLPKNDARVGFILQSLVEINQLLAPYNASCLIQMGTPLQIFNSLKAQFDIQHIFTNEDYEPYAIQRDTAISDWAYHNNIRFSKFVDHVLQSPKAILKADQTPYTVFTPYKNKWLNEFKKPEPFPVQYQTLNWYKSNFPLPTLKELGFESSLLTIPPSTIQLDIISDYAVQRNFPGINGTSRLGIHLRFGTLSIRKLLLAAWDVNATFMSELIWRDFYQSILFHYPYVVESAFKPAYNHIPWRNNITEFEAWKTGNTGYPIVDAGMRELNATGFMHNRVRMITASFLTKHLLIDWRWGEAYFAEKLLDFDLAANNGGWQWAAGSGCDAAPYFRIFNPTEQAKKFDPQGKYIRKWVPELLKGRYPSPIVEHVYARNRALTTYKSALSTIY